MRFLIGILLGTYCISTGISNLYTEKAFKIGRAGLINDDLAYKATEPTYYWVSTIFLLVVGILIFYGLFKNKKN